MNFDDQVWASWWIDSVVPQVRIPFHHLQMAAESSSQSVIHLHNFQRHDQTQFQKLFIPSQRCPVI